MQKNKLYVGNLNYNATSGDIEQLFANYGAVVDVKVIEGKGFAFVEMSSPEDAERAKGELNGTEFKGRSLRVDEARSRTDRPGGGGGFKDRGSRGNYGGRRY